MLDGERSFNAKRNENNNYYNFNVLDIMGIHNIIFSRSINLTLAEAKNLTKLSRQEFIQLFDKKKEQVKRKIKEYHCRASREVR